MSRILIVRLQAVKNWLIIQAMNQSGQSTQKNQPRLLIVDDDNEIRELLSDYLEKNGFLTLTAANGQEMFSLLKTQSVSLIILDLMLPDTNGLELCQQLRKQTEIPIIMLTAKGDPLDRVIGLELGADDYIAKPFNPRELLARIKVVLRRFQHPESAQTLKGAKQCRFGDWILDLHAHHLISSNQVVLPLSAAEFRLLEIFLHNPNKILSRDDLLTQLQGREAEYYDRSMDMQISRLRKRLNDQEGKLIKTMRGHGYILTSEVVVM